MTCLKADDVYCIGGIIYGYCDSEYCGGVCEPVDDCDCTGCDEEECCAK